jgi:hypothetical protein
MKLVEVTQQPASGESYAIENALEGILMVYRAWSIAYL